MAERKTRLSVAFNGDISLIPRLAAYGTVESVYGKLTRDLVGGGRPSFLMANIDHGLLGEAIKESHRQGLYFTYLLNSPCQSNFELTRDYNNRLSGFIARLVGSGVDAFVVTMPYMLQLIKRNFPGIRTIISTFAGIDSIRKAKIWEERGADRIILWTDVNRDFPVLRRIAQSVGCEIEIFANTMCLYQCPDSVTHAPCIGHAGALDKKTKGFYIDYHAYKCALRRLNEPSEFIRGRFVRPEDLYKYKDMGITRFKIGDRIKPTEWIIRAVKAYNDGTYEGNAADIIPYPAMKGEREHLIGDAAFWLFQPWHVKMNTIKTIAKLGESEDHVYIDNRKLDGFIEHYETHDCSRSVCDEDCCYCGDVAARAVSMSAEKTQPKKDSLRELLDALERRSCFGKRSASEHIISLFAGIFRAVRKIRPKKNRF